MYLKKTCILYITFSFLFFSFLFKIERHFSDGRKEIEFPDGIRKIIHPNGLQESLFPDGVIVREYSDSESREIVTPDGVVHRDM